MKRIVGVLFAVFASLALLPIGSAPTQTQAVFQIDFPIVGDYWISLPGLIAAPPLSTAEELFAAIPNAALVGKYDTATDTYHEWDGTNCGGAGIESAVSCP